MMWGTMSYGLNRRGKPKTAFRRLFVPCAATFVFCSVAQAATDCRLNDDFDLSRSRLGVCRFDVQKQSFAGSPDVQARCLLRPVMKQQALGAALDHLPSTLAGIVGTKMELSSKQFQGYLKQSAISGKELGNLGKSPGTTEASYFVIHDTSSPEVKEFPADRDSPTWKWNTNFLQHKQGEIKPLAHVMTNRVGQSLTMADLGEAHTATKFELCVDRGSKLGLFVHVENIQPRKDIEGKPAGNKGQGPIPGFPDSQYKRLALIYINASVRKGKWLIPAFHAVIDKAYLNGHDDPQNFDLSKFDEAIGANLKAILKP
jgi:hypothetical protein